MTRQRLYYMLFCFLIVSSINFILPAAGIAQSEENPAAGLASKMKLDALRTYIEGRIDTIGINSESPVLSAAEVVLAGNLKAYFNFKIPSMTILTKKQNLNYSRAIVGFNLAF